MSRSTILTSTKGCISVTSYRNDNINQVRKRVSKLEARLDRHQIRLRAVEQTLTHFKTLLKKEIDGE